MFRDTNRLKLTKGSDWSAVYEWTDGAKKPVSLVGAVLSAELVEPSTSRVIPILTQVIDAAAGLWRVSIKGRQTETLGKNAYIVRTRIRMAGGETKVFSADADLEP